MAEPKRKASTGKKGKDDSSFKPGSDGGYESESDYLIDKNNAGPAPKKAKKAAQPAPNPIEPVQNVADAINQLKASLPAQDAVVEMPTRERGDPRSWSLGDAAALRILSRGCIPLGTNYDGMSRSPFSLFSQLALLTSMNAEFRAVAGKRPFVPFLRAQIKSKCENMGLKAVASAATFKAPPLVPVKPSPMMDSPKYLGIFNQLCWSVLICSS